MKGVNVSIEGEEDLLLLEEEDLLLLEEDLLPGVIPTLFRRYPEWTNMIPTLFRRFPEWTTVIPTLS